MAENKYESVAIYAEAICKEHLGEKKYFVRIHYDGESRPNRFIEDLLAIGFTASHKVSSHADSVKELTATQYIVDLVKDGTAPGGDWTSEEQVSNTDKMEKIFLKHGVRWFPRRWCEGDLP